MKFFGVLYTIVDFEGIKKLLYSFEDIKKHNRT